MGWRVLVPAEGRGLPSREGLSLDGAPPGSTAPPDTWARKAHRKDRWGHGAAVGLLLVLEVFWALVGPRCQALK